MISKVLKALLISSSVAVLVACGGGSSSGGGAQGVMTPLPPPPPPPPPPPSTIITIEGQASKGLAYGARIALFDSNSTIAGSPEIIADTTSSTTDGRYSLTIDTAELPNLGDYLVVAAVLNDAAMLCDSPVGCGEGVDFGGQTDVKISDASIPIVPLYAILPKPDTGTTTTVNPNIFTQLEFTYFDYLVGSGAITFDPQTLAAAQTRISKIFGLTDSALYSLPFVDITQNVMSSDSNAIRASLIAGGLHGDLQGYEAIGGQREGFEWGLFYLSNNFFRDEGEIFAHENNDFVFETSLEDMFENAILIETVNSTSTNAFQNAVQSVKDSYAAIKASQPYVRTLNGELQPRGPNEPPQFLDTYYQSKDGEAGPIQLTVFDPNGIEEVITFVLNIGADSAFFTLSATGELTPNEPFDCASPKDEDGDQIYNFNVTISDGEFDVTEDLRLQIFTQDGAFCPGQSKSTMPNDKAAHGTLEDSFPLKGLSYMLGQELKDTASN